MRINKRMFILICLFLFGGFTLGVCGDLPNPDPILENNMLAALKDEIPDFVILANDIFGGGKPTPQGLEAAQKMGIKTIIDLRTPIEGTQEEQEVVGNLGMGYVNIPVIPSSLDDYEVDQVREILADPQNRPAIIHCSSSGRVLKLWTLYKNKYEDKE